MKMKIEKRKIIKRTRKVTGQRKRDGDKQNVQQK
jgi:hypothetical protein